MKFLKSIFKRKEEPINSFGTLSVHFTDHIKQSIDLLGHLKSDSNNSVALDLLTTNGIPENEAIEIIIFLPISFCRQHIPQIKWLETYIEIYDNGTQKKVKYSETISYKIIELETMSYLKGHPSQEVVSNILGRSAEFDLINKLLKNGGDYKDILLTETAILR